jgi:hypothetical protein
MLAKLAMKWDRFVHEDFRSFLHFPSFFHAQIFFSIFHRATSSSDPLLFLTSHPIPLMMKMMKLLLKNNRLLEISTHFKGTVSRDFSPSFFLIEQLYLGP